MIFATPHVSAEVAERIAKAFHEAYNKHCSKYGFRTEEWESLPPKMCNLMVDIVKDVIPMLEEYGYWIGAPEERVPC